MVSGQLGLRYQYMVKFTILFTQGEAYFFQSFFFVFFCFFVFFSRSFFRIYVNWGVLAQSERASEASE